MDASQGELILKLDSQNFSQRKIAEIVLGSASKKSTVGDFLARNRFSDSGPNVQIFDIETSPYKAYAWRRFKENINQPQVLEESQLLCWSAKPLGSETVKYSGPKNIKRWHTAKEERRMLEEAHHMMDQADVLIAHNGRRFDIPVLRTRMLFHGMRPPSPFQVIDTLDIARSLFKFPSNKLDDLAQYLGIGRKEQTGGFKLWRDCMDGVPEAWDLMQTYNIQDTDLLEEVYKVLAPWSNKGVNFAMFHKDGIRCTGCGSLNMHRDGYVTTTVSKFPAYQCGDCGKWSRGRYNVLDAERKKEILTHGR